MSGALYIVGTPIGNLKEITLRAIETLKNVDLIACEDTRHTKILLDKYSIKTPTTSYHKFNIKSKTGYVIDQIKSGRNIALVSDAGMPGVSDPGMELIKAAAHAGIKIEVIPGPTAAISALSASGIGNGRFIFEGFLPIKSSERKKRLGELAKENRTIILYEAPHRLMKTLEDLIGSLGDRRVCIARELTKKFEEVKRGRISEMIKKFTEIKPRGEFVIVIEGNREGRNIGTEAGEEGTGKIGIEEAKRLVEDLAKAGISKNMAVKITSNRLKVPKNKLYRAILK